ncbi:glycosyltransferase [Mesosutterella sp. OilRF-GAM-744-9]|uniref:Glycosyltransferase n=1 Tax=Mesosutterella porci TaxID=2915351 RepID=A0ABS9MSI8_9BURK|nr:glycosyl transferase family 90 [Mesosutterella sp. oilRF-744-WT-GAM-9]MCG5031593.1 glycosyltransferase [Mesosutterella sp. oilRF-744-WT-GAM-9]
MLRKDFNLYKIRPSYILKPRGKHIKLFYYVRCALRSLTPRFLLRIKKDRLLNSLATRPDRREILERAAYYNKLCSRFLLPAQAAAAGNIKNGGSNYARDAYEILRFFSPEEKIATAFGDNTRVPAVPSICKSRPIDGDNANCVLLNLNKIRHFVFLKDHIPFEQKSDLAIFRGACFQPQRKRFMEMYFGRPFIDCGDTRRRDKVTENPEWHKPLITLYDHLKYKFILCIEGNDVATNLKWTMSSNSVAVMPRPRYETWFMEGRLIPNYHYIEIRDDFSNLEEKLRYYIAHPQEAKAIARHANEWVRQFLDPDRELLTALLVMRRYFDLED